jgi:hypothetical protein
MATTTRLTMAVLVATTGILGGSGFAATPTPGPTPAPTAATHSPNGRRSPATPAPRATAQNPDDGTLRRLFRSLDDSHHDHGDRDRDDGDRDHR